MGVFTISIYTGKLLYTRARVPSFLYACACKNCALPNGCQTEDHIRGSGAWRFFGIHNQHGLTPRIQTAPDGHASSPSSLPPPNWHMTYWMSSALDGLTLAALICHLKGSLPEYATPVGSKKLYAHAYKFILCALAYKMMIVEGDCMHQKTLSQAGVQVTFRKQLHD